MLRTQLKQRGVKCINCGEESDLFGEEIPENSRTFIKIDDEGTRHEFTDHFGPSQDFHCSVCGAEWTVTEKGEQ